MECLNCRLVPQFAGLAQLIEHLICTQKVASLIPAPGSMFSAKIGEIVIITSAQFTGAHLTGVTGVITEILSDFKVLIDDGIALVSADVRDIQPWDGPIHVHSKK